MDNAVQYMNEHRDTLFPGWHVPTVSEFETLLNTIGDTGVTGFKKMITVSGWDDMVGTDDYGFSALPVFPGLSNNSGRHSALFASDDTSSYHYRLVIDDSYGTAAYVDVRSMQLSSSRLYYSVRLIRDY
jgi:uncharacterized protein (TIGR02145 family)